MSQFPAWAAGSKITAAGLTQMEAYFAIKPAQTSITSSTALTNDPDLQIVLPNAGTYVLISSLTYQGAATGTGDMKLQFNFTGTITTSSWTPFGPTTSNIAQVNMFGPNWNGAQAIGTDGAGVTMAAQPIGYLIAATGGTASVQWAQNTSSATATIMRAGSWVSLNQIA